LFEVVLIAVRSRSIGRSLVERLRRVARASIYSRSRSCSRCNFEYPYVLEAMVLKFRWAMASENETYYMVVMLSYLSLFDVDQTCHKSSPVYKRQIATCDWLDPQSRSLIGSELAGGEMTTRICRCFRRVMSSAPCRTHWPRGFKLVVAEMKCPICTLHRFLVIYQCIQMRITTGNPL
jgi:hypothetical protein